MRTRIRNLWLLPVLGIPLWWGVGCTSAEVDEYDPGTTDEEIEIGFAPLGLMTKALASPLEEGTTVRIVAFDNTVADATLVDFSKAPVVSEAVYVVSNERGTLSPCTVDENGKKIGNSGSAMTVKSEGRYSFYAVSPARSLKQLAEDKGLGISGIGYNEDVMTSYAEPIEITPESRSVQLKTFKRKCAKLNLLVAPKEGEEESFEVLKPTRLVLDNIPPDQVELVAGTDTEIAPGEGTESRTYEFKKGNFSPYILDGFPDLTLYQMFDVLPPKNSGKKIPLSITVQRRLAGRDEGDTEETTLTTEIPDKAFLAGNLYRFFLRVGKNNVTLQITVIPWNEVKLLGESLGDGSMTPPVIDPDPTPDDMTVSWTITDWSDVIWNKTTGSDDIEYPDFKPDIPPAEVSPNPEDKEWGDSGKEDEVGEDGIELPKIEPDELAKERIWRKNNSQKIRNK